MIRYLKPGDSQRKRRVEGSEGEFSETSYSRKLDFLNFDCQLQE